MKGICPYCGSDSIRIGQVLKTLQKDDAYYIFSRCLCKDCNQAIVGVRTFYEKDEMSFIRKEDMKELYGTTHGRYFGKWV